MYYGENSNSDNMCVELITIYTCIWSPEFFDDYNSELLHQSDGEDYTNSCRLIQNHVVKLLYLPTNIVSMTKQPNTTA